MQTLNALARLISHGYNIGTAIRQSQQRGMCAQQRIRTALKT